MNTQRNYNLTVSRFIKMLNSDSGSAFVKIGLASHEFPYSFLSITDLLDELGIENIATQVSKEDIFSLPFPFIIEINDGKEIYSIKDEASLNNLKPSVLNTITGRVILAEKLPRRKREHVSTVAKYVAPLLGLFLATVLLLNYTISHSILDNILYLTYFIGLGISLLIFLKSIGYNTKAADAICKDNSDCSFSQGGTFKSKIIPASCLLYYLVFFINIHLGFNIPDLNRIVIIPFLVSVVTIFYQVKVRAFCRLCLLLTAVIWIDLLILVLYPQPFILQMNPGAIILMLVSIAGAITIMTILEQYVSLKKANLNLHISLFKHKKNISSFYAILKQQRQYSRPAPGTFFYGQHHSDLQITMICSVSCQPCRIAHDILEEILERGNADFGLNVTFNLREEDLHTQTGESSTYLLKTFKTVGPRNSNKILNDWYKNPVLAEFKKHYPDCENEDVGELIQNTIQWVNENNILYTPTFFINGHLLPRNYNFYDFVWLLPKMSKFIHFNNRQILAT